MLKLSRLPAGEPEVFTTIQGEGVSAGVPSTFVRLSLCSLRCVWCDSSFTWDWERYDPRVEIVRLEVPEVARRVLAGGTRNVVITGGEPLLQQEEVALLATELKGAGRRLEVETSGTILPQPGLAALIDQWNVSPKLATRATRRRAGRCRRRYAGSPRSPTPISSS